MRIFGRVFLLMLVASLTSAQEPNPREIVLPTPARATTVSLAAAANRLAAVCADHKLRIWDIARARVLQTIPLGETAIDYLSLSPDGRWVFAGDHGGGMNIWNSDTGARQLELRLPHYPSTAVFSRDGKLFALAPMGAPVQVFDITSAKKLYETPGVIGGVAALAFSRDGAALATADTDTVVRIYDARSGKLRAEAREFLNEPLALDFTSDGRQVAAAGGDKTITIFDASSGTVLRRFQKTSEPVIYLEHSTDGNTLAAVLMKADDMTQPAPLVLWQASAGQATRRWTPPQLVLAGGWSRDGDFLAVGAGGDALHIWRVR